jgi:VWFA-related protein
MSYTKWFSAALFSAVLLGQQEVPDKTFRATVNVVVAPTIVIDHDGSYVAGLKPSDFRLYDNDKLQNIKVDEVVQPLSLVVVIQADSAMESILPKIQKIGPMLTTLLAGQDGEVAIMCFDHRIQTLQEFTSDTDKVKAALEKLRPGSQYSVMKDATREAVRMLARRPRDRRRVILLIAETRDKSSSAKTREVLAEIQFQNVILYSVNVNRLVTTLTAKTPVPRPDPIPPGGRHQIGPLPNTPTTSAQFGDVPTGNLIPVFVEIFKDVRDIFISNPVEVFTRYTGGREYSFLTLRDLEHVVGRVSEELHSQYMLSYNPDNKIEGGFHEIKVEVARPEAREWKVRTRPGYWMAAVPE